MDNYIPDVRQSEDHSLEEQMEEDMFLDAVVGNFFTILKRRINAWWFDLLIQLTTKLLCEGYVSKGVPD